MEYRINPNIALSESGLVFSPVTGESFTVNPIAFEILGLIRQGKSLRDIKMFISEKYFVEKQEMEPDLEEFLMQLKHHHLIREKD